MDILIEIWSTFRLLVSTMFYGEPLEFARKFIPFVLFFELPVYLVIAAGVLRYYRREVFGLNQFPNYQPPVSCVVLCYAEKEDVKLTIKSLTEQYYDGHIEILAMIDGASPNYDTYQHAMSMLEWVNQHPNRRLRVMPKWQRGGRVSSINSGLAIATGEVIMVLDGDTSFDNKMVFYAARHFSDPNVVGLAGNLRVRNARESFVTRLQSIEYLLSIHAGKVGLGEWNVVNNISGAFGVFRRRFIQYIGGWDSGTAEDLDMTLRLKHYFGRHPNLKIVFEPKAIGHTDAPGTFLQFFDQRHRWDGDLFYLYCRKHMVGFKPRLLGWKNMISVLWTGMLFQLVMPFIILFYSIFVFLIYDPGFVLAVWLFVYVFYFFITTCLWLMAVTMVSERKKEDIELAWCLPFMPLFTFATRVWSAVATLDEIFNKIHLDSSMAPWWVLKKTKF